MEFKSDHFTHPNLSGLRTGNSATPLTIGGGDMSMPLNRPGGVGSFALDRRKQINTLLIFNENVSEVVPNVEYRMDFNGGGTCGPLTMFIYLAPGFPKERPTIRFEPLGLQHRWLDAKNGNVIGAPGLNNFSAHSDLGRVVQVIKREFELNPPSSNPRIAKHSNSQSPISTTETSGWLNNAKEQSVSKTTPKEFQFTSANSCYPQMGGRGLPYPVSTNANHYSLAPGAQSSAYFNDHGNIHNHTPYSAVVHNGPSVSNNHPDKDVIAEVAALTDAELEELNENESALLKFCRNLDNPIMQSMDDKYEEIKTEMKCATDQNKTMSATFKTKRESLVEQYQQYLKIRSEYEDVRIQLEKARSKHSVTNISKLLEASSIADEEESERCADDFLKSGSNVEQFLKDYTDLRTSHIKKKAKLDSVMQQRNIELKQTSTYTPSWPKF